MDDDNKDNNHNNISVIGMDDDNKGNNHNNISVIGMDDKPLLMVTLGARLNVG